MHVKTCVTNLNSQFFSIKSELFLNVSYYRHTTQKKKMNTYKDFHIFACMSVIKTCVTELVLKHKTVNF